MEEQKERVRRAPVYVVQESGVEVPHRWMDVEEFSERGEAIRWMRENVKGDKYLRVVRLLSGKARKVVETRERIVME